MGCDAGVLLEEFDESRIFLVAYLLYDFLDGQVGLRQKPTGQGDALEDEQISESMACFALDEDGKIVGRNEEAVGQIDDADILSEHIVQGIEDLLNLAGCNGLMALIGRDAANKRLE